MKDEHNTIELEPWTVHQIREDLDAGYRRHNEYPAGLRAWRRSTRIFIRVMLAGRRLSPGEAALLETVGVVIDGRPNRVFGQVRKLAEETYSSAEWQLEVLLDIQTDNAWAEIEGLSQEELIELQEMVRQERFMLAEERGDDLGDEVAIAE